MPSPIIQPPAPGPTGLDVANTFLTHLIQGYSAYMTSKYYGGQLKLAREQQEMVELDELFKRHGAQIAKNPEYAKLLSQKYQDVYGVPLPTDEKGNMLRPDKDLFEDMKAKLELKQLQDVDAFKESLRGDVTKWNRLMEFQTGLTEARKAEAAIQLSEAQTGEITENVSQLREFKGLKKELVQSEIARNLAEAQAKLQEASGVGNWKVASTTPVYTADKVPGILMWNEQLGQMSVVPIGGGIQTEAQRAEEARVEAEQRGATRKFEEDLRTQMFVEAGEPRGQLAGVKINSMTKSDAEKLAAFVRAKTGGKYKAVSVSLKMEGRLLGVFGADWMAKDLWAVAALRPDKSVELFGPDELSGVVDAQTFREQFPVAAGRLGIPQRTTKPMPTPPTSQSRSPSPSPYASPSPESVVDRYKSEAVR